MYIFVKVGENPTAIEVVSVSSNMNILPNPASGQATVTFNGKGNITIYNMLGQTVYHVENVENEKVIPLNNLNSGVYLVKVQSGNNSVTKKMVVK
jgi:hypothetical protein